MATLQRNALVKACADKVVEKTDIKDLMQFFYESQYDWFDSLSNNELIVQADSLGLTDEMDEIE